MKKIDKGTYAVVTGASSGIGWAIALELASKGVSLILVARRKERLEQLKEIIVKNNKVEVLIIDTDLADLENCKRLVEKTKELEPQIIVNNAGFGQYGFFTELDLDKELAMIRLNIESLHVLTKLYLTSMKKGVIMNVASMAGF
ncbi:MAG: SDR family NAD(P)-dependent oxidoreductase, partial [Candidatus Izemoplasmatales bacterium]